MNAVAGRHWLAGQWLDAPGGGSFTLRQRIPPYEPAGTWPRADEALLARAFDAARDSAAGWREVGGEVRLRHLRDALYALRRDDSWPEHLGSYLGLAPEELEAERGVLDAVADAMSGDPVDSEAVCVVLARWTDLAGDLARKVALPLASGRPVVVLSDDRWPLAAEALAVALDAAGVPAGIASVLHGVSADLRAALIAGRAPIPSSAELELDLGGRVETHTVVVGLDEDLEQVAPQIVRRAFGRAETFSGQRPGRVGQVVCHARVFSSFSEALLAAISASEDVKSPVPMIDGAALADLRARWELGLDEGATMIHGGEAFSQAGSSGRNDRRAVPTIFTNVEPGMSICRPAEASPILCLLRADSDAAAQDIARSLG